MYYPDYADCSVDILLIMLGNFFTSTSPFSAEAFELSCLIPREVQNERRQKTEKTRGKPKQPSCNNGEVEKAS